MKLSEFFSLEEMLVSDYAARNGIDNSPSLEVVTNLTKTAQAMDKVRRLLGHPVIVWSGYRCPELNMAIKGSRTSDHLHGLAVDFICPGFGSVRQVFGKIKAAEGVGFDQLIVERGLWVHIGFGPRMRGQCLAFDGHVYTEVA